LFDVLDISLYTFVLPGKYLGTKKSGHLYANCDTMDEKTTFFFYLINRWGKTKNFMISSLDKAELFVILERR
jgi:hypothetical protein